MSTTETCDAPSVPEETSNVHLRDATPEHVTGRRGRHLIHWQRSLSILATVFIGRVHDNYYTDAECPLV